MGAPALFGLSLALAPAPASAVDCVSLTVGMAPYRCGNTFSRATAEGVEGSNSTTAGVTFQNLTGGSAVSIATAAGGMSGLARVEVDWGRLRAFSSADNGQFTVFAPTESESRVISRSQTAFADRHPYVGHAPRRNAGGDHHDDGRGLWSIWNRERISASS